VEVIRFTYMRVEPEMIHMPGVILVPRMGSSPTVPLSPPEAVWVWFLHEDLRMSFYPDPFFSVRRQYVAVMNTFHP
jgi:hypothetical protein